jgi:hypothetical protein
MGRLLWPPSPALGTLLLDAEIRARKPNGDLPNGIGSQRRAESALVSRGGFLLCGAPREVTRAARSDRARWIQVS